MCASAINSAGQAKEQGQGVIHAVEGDGIVRVGYGFAAGGMCNEVMAILGNKQPRLVMFVC